MAGNEPPIDGTASMNPTGGFRSIGRAVAGRLAAKVTTDGVRKLTNEYASLLDVLKKVRSELEGINKAGAAGGGPRGVGQGTPTGAAGSQPMLPSGPAGPGGGGPRGPGGFTYGRPPGAGLVAASQFAQVGLGVIQDRFQRNVLQSAPISSTDVMTSSMYGPSLYRGMEGRRFAATGEFGGTRADQQTAQQIALGFGSTMAGSQQFLGQAGTVVQASGGSINIAQAAAMTGQFANPMVSRRAEAMGIMTYKDNGVLNNPLQVGLDYIKDYEKRNGGIAMNEIDFANLRSPGSGHRARMKQIYGLSDEAIDTVIQAGMQNVQFRNKAGGGRSINFGSARDLASIGLNRDNALGLQAKRLETTTERREARLFGHQEDDMINRLGKENTIQEVLSDTESAFRDLLGPMHEFGRELDFMAKGLGALGLAMMGNAVMGGGGGGGLLGALKGLVTGGGGGGLPGAPGGLPGAPGAGGRLAGLAGKAGVLAKGGLIAGGVALSVGGMMMANSARTPAGAGLGVGMSTAGGALAGGMIAGPPGALIGAGIGLVGGAAFAAKNYFGTRNKKDVAGGFDEGTGMTDAQLIRSLGDYVKNRKTGRRGEGAGPKQNGRFDAFASRRATLLAAALDESMQTGVLKPGTMAEADELVELVNFFQSEGVFDDNKLWSNKARAAPYIHRIRGSQVWSKYFGSVADPFDFQPVTTEQAKSLIMTPEQRYQIGMEQSATGEGAAGDPVFALDGGAAGAFGAYRKMSRDPFPGGGDPVTGKGGSGATWDRLDSRMKERLTRLLTAAGGRVWLGNGWRSEAQQREMFLSRYVKDPNGEIKNFEGSNWRRVRGIPAAPPGRSMHEIGMAADLEGDLGWVVAHAHEFGLKHFANVNDEPHHVQPAEFPNSRAQFEKGGGTSDSSGGGASSSAGAGTAAAPAYSGGGGGVSTTAFSGIGYSIAAAAQGTTAGGGFMGGGGSAAASGAAGGGGGGGGGFTGPWPADTLAKGVAVVKLLKQAGFSGDQLTRMAAIAFHESGWNPNSWVEDDDDIGGGLFAINQKPWLDQGLTPKYSKQEIQDPLRSAQIAWEYFQERGYQPWTTRNKPLDMGIQARQAANVGDAVFDTGSMSSFTPAANVSINVSITSTGNARYDAKALGEAVRPVLTNVMAEISTKRGS